MNRSLNALYPIAMAAGLAGIAGAGLAAAKNHPVALAMAVLIAVFFVIGAWELAAFRRDNRALAAATEREVQGEVQDDWIAAVPLALRSAVQMRLEGQRVALPGLALAPALAGLLVLLGMLGTFIGLVITLSTTASALGASADLTALRSALGAPIQGLGLAFSASVAGVAGSAMLGLMVALARRERAACGALLDVALLGRLRPLTAAHQRALEQQALHAAEVERENAKQAEMLALLQQFTERIAEQLSAQNSRFHSETSQAYAALASSVDATLRGSLVDAAKEAGAAIQPAATAAMAAIAQEAASLHERVGSAVTDQLTALSRRFEESAERMAHHHGQAAQAQSTALQEQRELALQFLKDAGAASQRASELQAQRSASDSQAMLTAIDAMATRQQAAQAQADQARWASFQTHLDALTEQQSAARALVAQAAQQFATQTQALLDRVSEGQTRQLSLLAELDAQRRAEALADAKAMSQEREGVEQLLSMQREEALQMLRDSEARARQGVAEITRLCAEQAQAGVTALADAFTRLQASKESNDAQQLAAWRAELASAGAAQLKQQQVLADDLLANTRSLVEQAESYSQKTLAEAGAVLQAAGDAPRAAVEVVSALREQLAQSQAQDRAALLERTELMGTVSTLLASLQQAAGEQRAAIDSLVDRSAIQIEALGQRFTTMAATSGQALADAATNLAASAADVASVGEGFGEAIEQFQGANAQLVQHLTALEERLSVSITRSDEQLGYYVAQAREVIDLCLGSQKQILDALQGAANHG
ncbi:hypothetical protein [Paucibacter sp. Y2R2-4]|uniref:hypothetical protein n=1 Tax=Paucibacter sp. Y2R2-4 TaxID=2893553 RepID=UPI0021E45793|nr:hypothetical protein [Paucibacter sp. Y2R2-4]MCV2348285.1 hypothetical protein [Paucibacter sp. Y2R2-4]